MRTYEPSPIGIVLPMSSQEKDVENSLKSLEDFLGITFHTRRLESDMDSYVTCATRKGNDVTFIDGVHHDGRYKNIIGFNCGDSRSSMLHYILHDVTEISTPAETMHIPPDANTVDELVMKARLSSQMKWKRRNANGRQ